MKATTKAHLAVLGTNLFFAANFSLVKMVSPALVKPFGLNIFRVGISLALFWALWALGKMAAGIYRRDTARFLLCGLTGVAINQMLFIKGITLTSPIHASLLMLTTPLLITLFALWVLREKLTAAKIGGLLLGALGAIVLITSKEAGGQTPGYMLGDMLILINATSYSVYFILVKPLMERYSPLHVVRWVFTFGFLMILPFGWKEAAEVNFSAFSLWEGVALFSVVFTGTFLAYLFNAYGLQHLGASTTGAYIYTQPVFAVTIATIVFEEHLTLHRVLAALLIFAGVFLATRKRNKAPSTSGKEV